MTCIRYGVPVIGVMCVVTLVLMRWNYPDILHLNKFLTACDECENFVNMCDIHKFKDMINFDSSPPIIPRAYIGGCTNLIYNRLPKTASRTMIEVFTDLEQQNNYTTIFIDRGYDINANEEVYYNKLMSNVTNGRFVLVSHHYFHRFRKLLKRNLTNINIIREPASWFQSVFNFHKYDGRYDLWWTKKPIDDCITEQKCFDHVINHFGPVHFLCGSGELCRVNKNSTTLDIQMIKHHIKENYLLVGIYEELEDFVEVLEYLLPGMFQGLQKTFRKIEAHAWNTTKTKDHDTISEKAMELLKQKLHLEYEIYAFVSKNFYRLFEAVQRSKIS